MTAEELMQQIRSDRPPVVVDSRSWPEYLSGHVPGAIHIPFWTIPWNAHKARVAGAESIVVYCAHGPRAWIAGLILRLRGYATVHYLHRHMYGWKSAGLPLTPGDLP